MKAFFMTIMLAVFVVAVFLELSFFTALAFMWFDGSIWLAALFGLAIALVAAD